MFTSEPSPIASFKGFAVRCFRQGRTNLAERRLTRTYVLFMPTRSVVGVFLHTAQSVVEEELLVAAWRAQGCPEVIRPTAHQMILFGKGVPISVVPFAGYEDVWFQEGILTVAFKRREEAEMLQAKVATFSHKALQSAAEQALEAFRPRLVRLPKRIEICPLRPRILGQCTREGVIRLNESLATLPTSVMEETLAHELVHLEHFNHSSAFWRRLSELLPDWLPRTLAHYLS